MGSYGSETGEDRYDEVDVLKPGFNSRWFEIMGPLSRNNNSDISKDEMVNFPPSRQPKAFVVIVLGNIGLGNIGLGNMC